MKYFHILIFVVLFSQTIFSQNGTESNNVEVAMQNQTYHSISIYLEQLTGCYDAHLSCVPELLDCSAYYFETSLSPYSYSLDTGYTPSREGTGASVRFLPYAINKFFFTSGSHLYYSENEELYFEYDSRDSHYYGACGAPFYFEKDVTVRIVKDGSYYRVWLYNGHNTSSNLPSIESGWLDVSQSRVTVWDLEGQSNCDIHWNINPPGTPQMVSLTAYLGQHPTISWRANTEPDLSGYRVYKKLITSSGTITTYSFTTDTTYTDNDFTSDYKFGSDTAEYWVVAVDSSNYLSAESVHKSTDGTSLIQWKIASKEENDNSISTFELFSNYPNPFNPTTQISFQIPNDSFVNLIIYNSLGQKVAKLVNQYISSGKYSIQFNASNLPSGVYIYKLQAGEFNSVKKMMLTK